MMFLDFSNLGEITARLSTYRQDHRDLAVMFESR